METVEDNVNSESSSFRARLILPEKFKQAIIIANGAGAPMDAPFIRTFCRGLAERGYAAASFNFPYQEAGRKAPDRKEKLETAYLSMLKFTAAKTGLVASAITIGGKSMGGRIATQIAVKSGVQSLVLLGYPLHPPGKPESLRDEHLYEISARMLFISGDRDPFCEFTKFKPVLKKLKKAELFVVEGGGHSFEVPKKSGKTQAQIYEVCLNRIAEFLG